MIRRDLPRSALRVCVAVVGSGFLLGGAASLAAADAPSRSYELVSPPDKAGQQVTYRSALQVGIAASSRNGDVATFGSWGSFANAPSGMPSSYRAMRSPRGWVTEAVTPAPVVPLPLATVGYPSTWVAASPDLAVGVITTRDAFDPLDVNRADDVYVTRNGVAVDLASRGNGSERATDASRFTAISDDGNSVVFSSPGHLVPEDAARVMGDDLYFRRDGVTTLINQRSGGGLIDLCGSQRGARTARNMISADGSTIFFETHEEPGVPECPNPQQVYARNVNDGRTTQVSRSQRAVPDAPLPAAYEGASKDGRFVFFTSSEQLIDAPEAFAGGLYRYDMTDGSLTLLLDWRAGPVSKISDDGRVIYFTSGLDLAPGSILGSVNLFVAVEGEIRWIASDESLVTLESDISVGDEALRAARITPDGRHLLFATGARLTSYDPQGRRQVYLFDEPDNRLTCLSCDIGQRPAGSPVRGDASLAGREGQDSPITDDGSVVVFDTPDQLVANDSNATRDVYEYRDGSLRLVTPGRSNSTASLVGMAVDGRDVFFTTSESILDVDVDGGDFDMYDARVGGGFPIEAVPPTPVCEGDSCQGSPTSPTTPEPPGSEVLSGNGNVDDPAAVPARASLSVTWPSRRALRSAASSGRITLKLNTRGSGEVAARAVARIGRRSRAIASARRRLASAGQAELTLTLRLSTAARKTLRSQGSLAFSVTVRHAGISRTSKLNLRLADNDR